MKKSTGYFTPQPKKPQSESSKRHGSSSDDVYFNESVFQAMISDPNKKKLLLELINANKDQIEEYKRQEDEKKRRKPKCESPIQLYRRKALEQMERAKENANRADSPVESVASSVPSPVPENELLKGVVAFVEVKTKDKDRTPAVQAIMKTMGAKIRERFTKDVTHVVFKNGSFTTYQKARIVNAHLVSVLWLEAVRKNKHRVPEKNYPAFGLQDYDNNASIVCSQLQKDFDEVLKDERQKSMNLPEPDNNKSDPLLESDVEKSAFSDMDLTNLSKSSTSVFNVSSFVEKDKSDSGFKIPETNSICNESERGNLGDTSKISSDMSSLLLSDNKNQSLLKNKEKAQSFASDKAFSSLKLSESSKNLKKSSEMSSLMLSVDKSEKQQTSSKIKPKEDGSLVVTSVLLNLPNSTVNSGNLTKESSEMSSLKISTDKSDSRQNSHNASLPENNASNSNLPSLDLLTNRQSKTDDKSSDQRPSGSESLFKSTSSCHSKSTETSTKSSTENTFNKPSDNKIQGSAKRKQYKRSINFSPRLSSEMSSLKLSDDNLSDKSIKNYSEPSKTNVSNTSKSFVSGKSFSSINSETMDNIIDVIDNSVVPDFVTRRKKIATDESSCKTNVNIEEISRRSRRLTRSRQNSPKQETVQTTNTRRRRKTLAPINTDEIAEINKVDAVSVNSIDLKDNQLKNDSSAKADIVENLNKTHSDKCKEETTEQQVELKPKRRRKTLAPKNIGIEIQENSKKSCPDDAAAINDQFKVKPVQVSTRGRRQTVAAISKVDTSAQRKRCRSVGGNANSSDDNAGGKKVKRKLFNLDDSFKINKPDDDEERKKNRILRRQKSNETLITTSNSLVQNKQNKNVKTDNKEDSNSDSSSSSEIDEPKRKKVTKLKKDDKDVSFNSDDDDQSEKLKELKERSKIQSEESRVKLETPKKFKRPQQVQSEGKRLKPKSKLPIMCSPVNRRSTLEFQTAATSSQSQKKIVVKPRKLSTIVCTKMHRDEIRDFNKIVTKIGGFEIENNVTSRTSHLVAGEPKRTLNMLRAMARGCWILKKDWLYESKEAKKWLPEEDYEMLDFSPTVQKTRRQRQAFGASYAMDIFRNCGPIYVSKDTNMPHQNLRELIHMCKGNVTTTPRASVIVGKNNSRLHGDVVNVDEKWVLDSITFNKVQPFDKYLLSANCNDSIAF